MYLGLVLGFCDEFSGSENCKVGKWMLSFALGALYLYF